MSVELEITNTHNHSKRGADPTLPTREFMSQLLDGASYSGTWQLIAIEQTTMNHAGRFKVRSVNGRSIRVRVKPGDNATCWDWELFPPARLSVQDVAADLERFNGWDGNPRKLASTELPAEKRLTLAEKLAGLEAACSGYRDKKEAVEAHRARYQELLRQADEAEAEANRLEIELAEDYAGRNACEAIETLHKLLTN